MEERMLVTFKVENNTYRVFGKFRDEEWKRRFCAGSVEELAYPVFFELRAEKKTENGFEPYEPVTHAFSGRLFLEADMLTNAFDCYLMGCDKISVVDMNGKIRECLDVFRDDIVKAGGEKIPKRVLNEVFAPAELSLVTDRYIYYNRFESVRAYDFNNRELIAKYELADVHYCESCENIIRGKENCLYGEVSSEFRKVVEREIALESKKSRKE